MTDDDSDDQTPMSAEDLAILQSIEADDPEELSPLQRNFAESKQATIIPPSDRGALGGAPIGWSGNDVAPGIILSTINPDHGVVELTRFDLSSRGDPDLVEALRRHGPEMEHGTDEQRIAATIAAFKETAAAKRAKVVGTPEPEAKATILPKPKTKSVPRPETDGVAVSVFLGKGLGSLDVVFHDVIIHGRTLVLVTDPSRPTWVPPQPDDDADPAVMTLRIAGLDEPVRVFPLGLSYPYEGRVHYILVIDRPTE